MFAKISGKYYKSGDIVLCEFECGTTIQGVIYIDEDNSDTENYRAYICHNHPSERHGSISPVLYGYLYSWVFNYDVESDTFTEDVNSLTPQLNHETKMISVCEDLERFFAFQCNPFLFYLLRIKAKPFEQFTEFSMSPKPGFVIMKGDVDVNSNWASKTGINTQKKTVEIKLSRVIKKHYEALSRISDKSVIESFGNIDDVVIENLHNAYVAYQKGETFKLNIVQGDDILKGYMSSNYSLSNQSTLHKSCMSDKTKYLGIYTTNKEVSLAYLQSDKGIEARCIVWKIDDKFYFDRIYYTIDWVKKVLEEKLLELGYNNLQKFFDTNPDKRQLAINLEHTEFDQYPYLDSFKWLSDTDGCLYYHNDSYSLSSLPSATYRKFSCTDGRYESVKINK